MIKAYYKFIILPDEVRALHKIRAKARLDCIAFADLVNGGYQGLHSFLNAKGQLILFKTPCNEFVKANSKRRATWTLINNSLNFSSIYIEELEYPEYGYGYPNASPYIGKDKKPNPLHPFKNDAYLFLVNAAYTEIEVFIIPNGRNLINSYYQTFLDGGLDDEIRQLRQQAKPYFQYIGL